MRSRFLSTAALVLLFVATPLLADHKRHSHHHHGHQKSTGQQILGFALKALPYLLRSNQNSYSRYSYSSHGYGSYCPSYGYRSYSYSTYPHGTYYRPGSNYFEYYLPPTYHPAEAAYGPQPLKQFMGLDRNFGLRPLATVPDVGPPTKTAKPVRASNPETIERARKFVGFGDKLFKEGKYHEALQQYKTATRVAPDLAEAHLRQGFALTGSLRYELAADAFKRGMELDPAFAASDFRLDPLYDGARLAKSTHLESLAAAALKDPSNAKLTFVLGMFLHYGESAERAKKFFQRAADLSGGDDGHLRPFVEDGPKLTGKKDAGVDA